VPNSGASTTKKESAKTTKMMEKEPTKQGRRQQLVALSWVGRA